ncbi:MAG: phage tail tape measure protein [Hyphomicrobiaceae bacterium]|nr:phage tail tape measure protein [Hyphomicrobiaceae bacterium]MCC0010264.1 phage tail tape measure protein [Hyphomicrobiaceae bacterium]
MNGLDDPNEEWVVTVSADTRPLQRSLADAEYLGRRFGSALTTAFEGIALKGKSLGDVLKSLALSLSNIVLKAALKPLEQGIGNLFSGLFTGGFGFANGSAFQSGMPVPFASGGVIQSPITFPLGQGRIGVAGERGAEAIMPLARGSDGRLGVVASGGGGGVNVTLNVTTPDAESFRRSEAQMAAMLARAVSFGQRNL